MCNFFSFVTNGGKYYYFNWEQRQQILKKQLTLSNGQTIKNADSHSEIVAFYKINIDKSNAYEFDFFKQELIKDQIRIKDNYNNALAWAKTLNVKEIVPLNIKLIINPIKIENPLISIDEAVELLKKWVAVRYAVRAAVRYAVRDAVGYAVWDAVGAAVGVAVGYAVRDAVGAAVGDAVWDAEWAAVWDAEWAAVWDAEWAAVWDAEWAAVWDAVGDAVWVYVSSFLNIKYLYDFSSCLKLWESGYVPSFDGKIWKLHGYHGKIVWDGKIL